MVSSHAKKQEEYNGLRIATDLSSATNVLRSAMDGFIEQLAMNLKRSVNSRVVDNPSSEWGAAFKALYCHFAAVVDGSLPDFKRVSQDLNPTQVGHGFHPASYLRLGFLTTNPSIVVKAKLLLEKYPPFFVVVSDDFVNTLQGDQTTLAYYHPDSNLTVIRKSDYERMKDTSDLSAIYAHEALHYLSHAFGGGESHKKWFGEGTTEYLAQRIVRQNGENPTHHYYSEYTRSVYYLAKLIGDDVLLAAYLTGDMSRIRGELDSQFGFGTYDKIINATSYEKNMEILKDLCTRTGFNTTEFDDELRSWGKKV